MNKGLLSEYFAAVAVKTLSSVDAEPGSSHQHEVGGKETIGKVLGPWDPRVEFAVTYIWLGAEQESIEATGKATWYNPRAGKPRSPEPRLYYPSNPVTGVMSAGDTLFLAKRPDNTLFFIVARAQSTIESQLLWLFGIDEPPSSNTQVALISGENDSSMDFPARLILDELGIEFEDPQANSIDSIVSKFDVFPKTKDLADLARLTLPTVSALDDPDAALTLWLDHEERLFRQLERRLIGPRLVQGFLNSEGEPDVDAFAAFSLAVHNRRKSRMGHSLEHHLAAVLDAHMIRYRRGATTERGNHPDFLFPSTENYMDQTFDAALLSMVGAKASCKERWRQVAFEADRIAVKHLVTLEPAITEQQTDQMSAAGLQLVLPSNIHATFSQRQRAWLWSISELLGMLAARQSGSET